MRAVEHYGRKARFDALVAAFVSAVVEMKRYWNGDVEPFNHCFYHIRNGFEARHIFACAFRYAENDGGVELLSGL